MMTRGATSALICTLRSLFPGAYSGALSACARHTTCLQPQTSPTLHWSSSYSSRVDPNRHLDEEEEEHLNYSSEGIVELAEHAVFGHDGHDAEEGALNPLNEAEHDDRAASIPDLNEVCVLVPHWQGNR